MKYDSLNDSSLVWNTIYSFKMEQNNTSVDHSTFNGITKKQKVVDFFKFR